MGSQQPHQIVNSYIKHAKLLTSVELYLTSIGEALRINCSASPVLTTEVTAGQIYFLSTAISLDDKKTLCKSMLLLIEPMHAFYPPDKLGRPRRASKQDTKNLWTCAMACGIPNIIGTNIGNLCRHIPKISVELLGVVYMTTRKEHHYSVSWLAMHVHLYDLEPIEFHPLCWFINI